MCRGVSHSHGELPWLLTTHQPCLWLPTTLIRPSHLQGRPWASSTQSRCPISGSRVTPARSSSRGCPRGSRSESLAPLAPRTWRGSSRWLTRSSSPSPGTQGMGEERGGKGRAGPCVSDPWPGLPAGQGGFPSIIWILGVGGGGPAGQLGCREPQRDETRSPAPPIHHSRGSLHGPRLPASVAARCIPVPLGERPWPTSEGRRPRQ